MIGELLYLRLGQVKEDPLSEHLPKLVTHVDGGPDKIILSGVLLDDAAMSCEPGSK